MIITAKDRCADIQKDIDAIKLRMDHYGQNIGTRSDKQTLRYLMADLRHYSVMPDEQKIAIGHIGPEERELLEMNTVNCKHDFMGGSCCVYCGSTESGPLV